jgi:hypothetical protein
MHVKLCLKRPPAPSPQHIDALFFALILAVSAKIAYSSRRCWVGFTEMSFTMAFHAC